MLFATIKRYALPTLCIIASLALTRLSIDIGFERAANGEEALISLHIGLFFAAVALVFAAILLMAQQKR